VQDALPVALGIAAERPFGRAVGGRVVGARCHGL
jgi:hypothetical protein